jgi:hypothetical protein
VLHFTYSAHDSAVNVTVNFDYRGQREFSGNFGQSNQQRAVLELAIEPRYCRTMVGRESDTWKRNIAGPQKASSPADWFDRSHRNSCEEILRGGRGTDVKQSHYPAYSKKDKGKRDIIDRQGRRVSKVGYF